MSTPRLQPYSPYDPVGVLGGSLGVLCLPSGALGRGIGRTDVFIKPFYGVLEGHGSSTKGKRKEGFPPLELLDFPSEYPSSANRCHCCWVF